MSGERDVVQDYSALAESVDGLVAAYHAEGTSDEENAANEQAIIDAIDELAAVRRSHQYPPLEDDYQDHVYSWQISSTITSSANPAAEPRELRHAIAELAIDWLQQLGTPERQADELADHDFLFKIEHIRNAVDAPVDAPPPRKLLVDALLVLVRDPKHRQWLESNDPMALSQALTALRSDPYGQAELESVPTYHSDKLGRVTIPTN